MPELITLCSGKVTNSRTRAAYILGEYVKDNFDGKCVMPNWILDSISEARMKDIRQYIIKKERDDAGDNGGATNADNVQQIN